MSLFITSLNSGSNGNCYYIGNQEEAILVDVGISCRETEKRMQRLGLSMKTVKAIFVSHEHSDHITGIPVLSRKYQLPVYITAGTLHQGGLELAAERVHSFSAHVPVQIGALQVTAFPKLHDAADPHSFIVRNQEVTIGIFTDIGQPCAQLTAYFKMCHAAFLEANYDENMLLNGRYPWMLKNRIRGGRGHLSNAQALSLFCEHKPPFMSHLLLAHLSKDNNDPSLVEQLFRPHARGTEIVVASRYAATALYYITAAPGTSKEGQRKQLSLF
ncbi:Phosphoribosyl 1,2-cyclic phosphodiesterase [Chitinophaga costaii]|uniref:Phosphoribosyl 1,2-cyclic phosphodiesterase n=1 Tax=Chitinophaga costaii TaxID=1335309 RepID=A0A1C4ENM0_9BACT|nr:MBL fold metallo-hydrolase [Chitinophaga costaii]PUZ22471.1 MBL fold metallo-hydrolase [Chitinophaga costaii]SCC45195.1 Phosphoribosyl 1,2-cyclic phosphodiesterase [Chitinophaga costaii]